MDRDLIAQLNELNVLSMIGDVVRIVDPINKTVSASSETDSSASLGKCSHCFDYWERDAVCENCISMRAHLAGKSFVRMDYVGDEVLLVTAVPCVLEGQPVVVEIIKNITNSVVADEGISTSLEQLGVQTLIDGLNRMAYSDPLTGLHNRHFVAEKLPVDLRSCALLPSPLAMVMADLDHFKLVNDEHGHAAGDAVLKAAGEAMVSCIRRDTDWVARYGGEEFLICLPGADRATALATAELMRSTLESTPIEYEGIVMRVTASFGVCSVMPTTSDTTEAIIEAADQALYRAKDNGRNRVEI